MKAQEHKSWTLSGTVKDGKDILIFTDKYALKKDCPSAMFCSITALKSAFPAHSYTKAGFSLCRLCALDTEWDVQMCGGYCDGC